MSDKDTTDAFGFEKGKNAAAENQILTAPTMRDDFYYNMNHEKRGMAIIFNHEVFTDTKLERRRGTNVDYKNLKDVFNNLGYDVNDLHNTTKDGIFKCLKEVSEMDHTNYDSLVIIVLSHGEQNLLHAYDSSYKPELIWSYFTSDKCPSLAGKPKLFFIQACQGTRLDDGFTLKERTESDGQSSVTFRIPTYADILIAFSTVPGFFSWRNQMAGSWFIQALCTELNKYAFEHDLLTILTFVCRRVAIDFESITYNKSTDQKKQVPCITSMLTRLLKFSPLKNSA